MIGAPDTGLASRCEYDRCLGRRRCAGGKPGGFRYQSGSPCWGKLQQGWGRAGHHDRWRQGGKREWVQSRIRVGVDQQDQRQADQRCGSEYDCQYIPGGHFFASAIHPTHPRFTGFLSVYPTLLACQVFTPEKPPCYNPQNGTV